MFSVLVTRLISKKLPSSGTLVSLIPITVGVTLSAVSEIQFDLWGFISAMIATFLGVLQSTYTKVSLQRTAMDPMLFHLYTCVVALTFTLPGLAYTDLYTFSEQRRHGEDFTHQGGVPWLLIVISLLSHYLQNIASIYVLSEFHLLSHQVASTLKRLLVIVGAILYFQNPVSASNAMGILLALGGFFWYGTARSRDHRHSHHHGHRHAVKGKHDDPSAREPIDPLITHNDPSACDGVSLSSVLIDSRLHSS